MKKLKAIGACLMFTLLSIGAIASQGLNQTNDQCPTPNPKVTGDCAGDVGFCCLSQGSGNPVTGVRQ